MFRPVESRRNVGRVFQTFFHRQSWVNKEEQTSREWRKNVSLLSKVRLVGGCRNATSTQIAVCSPTRASLKTQQWPSNDPAWRRCCQLRVVKQHSTLLLACCLTWTLDPPSGSGALTAQSTSPRLMALCESVIMSCVHNERVCILPSAQLKGSYIITLREGLS